MSDVTAAKTKESPDTDDVPGRSRVARVLLWIVVIDLVAILIWAGLAFAC